MIDERVLQAIATIVEVYGQREQAAVGDEAALGFCDPPKGAGGDALYISDEVGQFYKFHEDRPQKEQHEYMPKRGLACQIVGLRLATKPFEGEDSLKLRLDVLADKSYMIEKTLTTNFTRGLIFSLARLGRKIKNVVTIEIAVPPNLNKKTCFCNIYDENKRKISEQHHYLDKEEFSKIEECKGQLSKILESRKVLTKRQIEEIDTLQKQEEVILLGLIEQIQKNLI